MGQDLDPRAVGVFLTAEAALLEARIRILQEAIDDVSTRIERSAERLRRLREQPRGESGRTPEEPPTTADPTLPGPESRHERPERSAPCPHR
ncbi:hypothetical protein ACWDE0_39055 [Streptomyces sp. 900105755]|uniref:hypothetical protein n=1 Tax=Streptomyces sp. Ag109_O5-10 TaxID=1855349 RepID=UPI00089CA37B|nr:hypothetical protein [Streptomyces sp. Ag109_O5-10]SEF15999.1 hypothetical protein SAMN05216533_7616 [Streptomyces sp. Ag109_O5-10]